MGGALRFGEHALPNAGLAQILEVSAPVLSAIYPVAIVLIALSFFQRWLEGRRWVYPPAVLYKNWVFSVLFALKGLKVPLDFLDALPLADVGLAGCSLPGWASFWASLLRPKEIQASAVPAGTARCQLQKATGPASGLLDNNKPAAELCPPRFRANRRSRRGGRNATSRRRR